MIEVDADQTLADIRDTVRQYQDEVPELQEVKISANKAELIEQVNSALDEYIHRLASEDGDEIVFSPTEEETLEFSGEESVIGGWSLREDGISEDTPTVGGLDEDTASRDEEFDVDEDAESEDTESEDSETEDTETEDDDGLKPGQAQGSPSSAHPGPQRTIP